MKYAYILYFVFAVFIIGFGSALLINGMPISWKIVCILLIGVYFLYRGIATCVNQKRRREREEIDNGNDPANAYYYIGH